MFVAFILKEIGFKFAQNYVEKSVRSCYDAEEEEKETVLHFLCQCTGLGNEAF